MSTSGHRPGGFKKPAKPHKSWKGKKTKGEINEETRGRAGVRQLVRSAQNAHRAISKDVRRNKLNQLRNSKMAAAIERRRMSNSPILVTLISLGNGARPVEFVNKLEKCDETIVRTSSTSTINFAVPRFKSRIAFSIPKKYEINAVLDSVKVSDVLCILWPINAQITEWDEQLLTMIKANGMPTIINVVPGLGGITQQKKKEDIRKNIESIIIQWSISNSNVFPTDTPTDGVQLIRALIETRKKPLVLQARHSYMLVENVEAHSLQDGKCTLVASGYLRGPEWNANNLVYLPGLGDYQIDRIETARDPHPLRNSEKIHEVKVIAKANENRQSAETEIAPNDMDGEQTWPTQEEIDEADREMRKVPKGTSSYQAAWILDENDDDDDDDDDDEDNYDDDKDDEDGDNMEEENDFETEGELEDNGEKRENEYDQMDMQSEAGETTASEMMEFEDEDINMDEVEKYRRERENAQWPDEIDTPMDIPARIRFQKYRGLKSFRTSTWDPKENLPTDYARIFQFANYKKTKKTVLSKIGILDEDSGDAVISKQYNGVYASVHVINVPIEAIDSFKKSTHMVLFQPLPHEQKMSILNMVLRKHPSCTVPVENNQSLIFYVGFRQFEANALFSSNIPGDKFKMERFAPQHGTFVATVFAPITFNPATVICFRKDDKGRQELMASGSVLDSNPDRIVLKRVVLSGHPYKINKRAVVARYMFFNREDIEWFKPVELFTPSGRRGHIREAVGTHGHMKCKFDQQLSAQDSIMMALYKRVFPKWDYTPYADNLNPSRFVDRSRIESISLVKEDAMEE
ncbi:unnamed protein product [Caenorhabditis bovis]|uniref:Pre-rRNA-processing protein TSR1 homolog n=1 Tax=Caenorhabditis bovis TaxID=2654633 RepID=A0A8S1FBM1_9PELO|nr:unnamed protein product [Caenorhabditis bovis]